MHNCTFYDINKDDNQISIEDNCMTIWVFKNKSDNDFVGWKWLSDWYLS
jgi:hypothetical protein